MSGTDGGAGTVDGIVEEAGSRPRSWLNRDGNTAMMFRVNRRRKSADPTLFESQQPGAVGEHFLLAFQWGVPLSLTKKDVERRWQAGNRKVEQSTAMISGVIGFERDATGQDSRFDPASQSWVEEPMPRHLGSQAPFLFDPITRNLLVMRHPDFSVGGTAQVFEQILERGEMLRDPLSPTDWDVDPVLDTPTPANQAQANVDVEDDVDTDFQIPWLPGLAIAGIAAAGLLAAWHTQRRRRIRAHKPGDPIPVMSEPDRELISQLRAIAAERHHAAVDTAFRYLATTIGSSGVMPSITVARAGRHSVELLLDNPQTPTPTGFLRLDQQTIVINPGITDEDIATAIRDRQPPAPTLVALGADDIGTFLIDLERTAALAIEAATDTEAVAVATALLTELATQPWADGLTVLAHGLPTTIDPNGRVTWFDDIDDLISGAETHLRAQSDDIIANGTHTLRSRTNTVLSPTVVVLGPGEADAARVLAAAATQPGSALALICCKAITNSAWRLVTTNGRTTLEPTGLTVAARHLRPSTLDNQSNERLVATFGPPNN